MNRRNLLERLIVAAMGAGLVGPSWLATVQAHDGNCEGDVEDAESLRYGLQQLARRDSSEQSTPMFLSLENLAIMPGDPAYVPDRLNAQVTARFRHYVDLLLQYESEPDESEVAALIELIAESDLVPAAARVCR